MKFTDKNGNDIECSVKEYLELTDINDEKPKSNRDKTVTIPKKPKKCKRKGPLVIPDKEWKRRVSIVKNLICNNPNKTFTNFNLFSELGKHQYPAAVEKLKKELLKNPEIKYFKKKKRFYFAHKSYKERKTEPIPKSISTNNDDKPNKGISRHKFMKERTKYLQIQDPRMSMEKAMGIAAGEWDRKGRIVKSKVSVDSFPALYGVSPSAESKVIDIISNCIANKGKLGYFDFKNACNWENANTWLYFIRNFMYCKTEIAEYFSSPDKFCHKKVGNYDYIFYE